MMKKVLFAATAMVVLLTVPYPLKAQDTATLDTVVVTASRTEEKLREVSTNVTVISEETIKKSSATDLGDLLRQQGFQVMGYNRGKAVTIRGMSQSRGGNDLNSAVLILLNGRRFGGPTMDFIGLTNVERIEVIRGPAAVQYGSSAMGGVINIITKRGSEKTSIYAEAGVGSFDLERFKLAASGQSKTGLIDFSFGASQQYQGDYDTGLGWTWYRSRPGTKIGFNSDVGVNFYDHHRVGIEFTGIDIRGTGGGLQSLNGGAVSSHNPTQPIPGQSASYGFSDMRNFSTAFTYEGKTEDEHLSWMGRYAFGKYTVEGNTFSGGTPAYYNTSSTVYPNGEQTGAGPYSTLSNRNLTATISYDDGGLWSLSGGVDYITYDYTYSYTGRTSLTSWSSNPSLQHNEINDLGFFLSGRLRLLEDDSLILSAGGRYDRFQVKDLRREYSRTQTNFAPSVGLAWLPVDWLKLRTNYSRGFRMPTVSELFGSGTQVLDSSGLDAEESTTWEIGADVSWKFMTASLTYFHSKYDNKIFSTSIPGSRCPTPSGGTALCYKSVNTKGATLAGWELGFSADIGQALEKDFELRPYINLTWLPTRRNEDHTPGSSRSVEALGFDDLMDVKDLTMSYGVRFFEPNIDLAVNIDVSYSGKMKSYNYLDTPGHTYQLGTTGGMADDFSGVTLVNLLVEKRLVEFEDMGKLKARVEVNNLFDKYDEAYPHYPGPGRNFYLGLAYEY